MINSLEMVLWCWNRLLRDVVAAPSLPNFMKHLDNALRHVVWYPIGLFQVRIFYDSVSASSCSTPTRAHVLVDVKFN